MPRLGELLKERHLIDLAQRRNSRADLAQARIAEEGHALFSGHALDPTNVVGIGYKQFFTPNLTFILQSISSLVFAKSKAPLFFRALAHRISLANDG